MPLAWLPGMSEAWLLPALSLLAFAIIVFWGQYLPGKGALVALLAIGLGLLLFWFVLGDLLGKGPASFSFAWLSMPPFVAGSFAFPGFELRLGMIVDPLAVLMLGIVSFVALMVQVYSLGYMKGEARFGWYFAAHALFAAAMLGLVLADNFLILYVAWELVGLCSYLLIGFWYERRSAAEAAKKAFVTTRIGDVGFLIGILLLFKTTGTFSIKEILHLAETGQLAAGMVTAAAILVFLGALGKSAQFPLHVWLPDAMEGPTPVSALIHAATMVAAGVYLVARTFPLFLAAPAALLVVTVIGLITTLLASTMALVMTDFKRILAYSTVSKLGFMMVALGSGEAGLTAAMFYLMTHAFFKALLFLGAGSVLHATGKTDIYEMGGLWRQMPLTAVTFGIAALALAGFPLLSGFWSKDEIINVVWAHQPPLVFGIMALAAFLSAAYITRPLIVVFFGKARTHDLHPHEAPWVMAVPLVLLAIPSLLSGFLALDTVGGWLGLPGGFGSFLYGAHPEPFHLNLPLALFSSLLALLGIFLVGASFAGLLPSPERIAYALGGLYRIVKNKYYFDDAYQWLINRIVLALSNLIALFDRLVVNDLGVNGTGMATVFAGYVLRYHETGKFYNYALGIALGVIFVIAVVILAPV